MPPPPASSSPPVGFPSTRTSPSSVRSRRRLLAPILALGLALGAIPLWWGLPSSTVHSWAFDEISPNADGKTVQSRHMGRYPPLHYHVLRALYAPVRLLDGTGILSLSTRQLRTTLQILGRSLSLILAVGALYLLFRSALLVVDSTASLLATLLMAVNLPFVFYAKTINLEAAYVFWFALSVFFLLRVFRRHRLSDYLLLGATTALAVCTKDQAYGLYLALPFLLIGSLHRHRFEHRPSLRSLAAVALDRRIVLSGVTAIALFGLIHNLIFDFRGFLFHVRMMTGPGSEPSRLFEHSLDGHAAMLAQAGRHVVFSMGWPAAVATVVGIAIAAWQRRRHRHLLALLLPLATYYAFFIGIILYHRVRFFLPVCLVLSLFAGLALARLWEEKRVPRAVAALAIAAVVTFPFLRAVSLDLSMLFDSRYFVESWLADNTDATHEVMVVGNHEQRLPRGFGSVSWRRLADENADLLRRRNPRFLVYNPDEVDDPTEIELRDRLDNGELNYRPLFRYRYRPWLDLIDTSGVSSNLTTVNPTIAVLERMGSWGLSDAEIGEALASFPTRIEDQRWVEVRDSIRQGPVLDGRSRLTPETLAYGLHFDAWTRGRAPAALVITNPGPGTLRPVLRLTSQTPNDRLPVTVRVLTRSRTFEAVFERRGTRDLRLSPVRPGTARMYVLHADKEWTAPARRQLGVHLQVLFESQAEAGPGD